MVVGQRYRCANGVKILLRSTPEYLFMAYGMCQPGRHSQRTVVIVLYIIASLSYDIWCASRTYRNRSPFLRGQVEAERNFRSQNSHSWSTWCNYIDMNSSGIQRVPKLAASLFSGYDKHCLRFGTGAEPFSPSSTEYHIGTTLSFVLLFCVIVHVVIFLCSYRSTPFRGYHTGCVS